MSSMPEAPDATAAADTAEIADTPEISDTPDAALLAAHDLARAALREVTPESTIGEPAGYTVEDGGAVSLRFHNRLAGYPGWFWTVTLARVADAEPTVLEVELLPGDAALLAPDWVPWAVRLAEYQAAQVALAEAEEADTDLEADLDDEDDEDGDDLDDDELDDAADLDAGDFDADGSPILHAGDVDGVDIDELDPTADEDDVDELAEPDLPADDEQDDSDGDAADDDDGAVDDDTVGARR